MLGFSVRASSRSLEFKNAWGVDWGQGFARGFGQDAVAGRSKPRPYKSEMALGFDEIGKGARVGVEIGEDGGEIGDAVMADEDFAEHGAEVGGEREVTAVVELMIVEA